MQMDLVRVFDILKAHETSGLDLNHRQGRDRELSLAARDEVILFTEAKRRQIFGRLRDQVIERLRSVPISRSSDREVDKMVAEVTDALDTDLLRTKEREQIKREGLGDLYRRTT